MEKVVKKLSESDIESLMSDWFVRDGDTFTFIPEHKKMLDWEDKRTTDDYSSYLISKDTTVVDLVRRAHFLARNVVSAMTKTKVSIKLSKKSGSFTNGISITIATDYFSLEYLEPLEKADIFLGLVVHELCHINYTNFTYLNSLPSEFKNNKIIGAIFNILEDERIERHVGTEFPGFVRFLERTKRFYFDNYFEELRKKYEEELKRIEGDDAPKKEEKVETVLGSMINLILKIIRYPKDLEISSFDVFGEYLVDIKNILTPYPSNTEDTYAAACSIYEVIKELVPEVSELKEKKLSEIGLEELVTLLKPISSDEYEPIKCDKITALDEGDITGSFKVDGRTTTIIETDDKGTYLESLHRVRKLIPAVSKILIYSDKDYKLATKSTRNGYLDQNKLVDAYQGVDNVYQQFSEVKSKQVAVCILIDESGSMGSYGSRVARDCAVLLNEAIQKVPSIQLFIYGHTADEISIGITNIHVYKDLRTKNRFSLGRVSYRTENRDGDAILKAAKLVREQTNRKCLMFILSDGAPSANDYRGVEAIKDTANKVKSVERMNFDVIQIAINNSYDPSLMFKNYVKLVDMNRLPNDLGKLVKKTINKNR